MYHKRLKTVKSIGYVPMDGNITHHEISNAIFDYQSYLDPFLNDLKTAQHEVYVSSPSLSKDSVELFMETITELLLKGVLLYWLNENCQRYCVIHDELIWYGSHNF